MRFWVSNQSERRIFKMAEPILTQSRLKEVLHYCPETGVFTRLVSTGNARAGEAAGNVNKVSGYLQIRIDFKLYQAHRLAWLYVHGEFPPNDLDHINRVRSDNRIGNLRLSTRAENLQNQSMRSNNTSGHVGVSWYKRDQKWLAQIKINYKTINLGFFTDLTEAISAYASAKAQFHTFNPQLSHAKPKTPHTRPISIE